MRTVDHKPQLVLAVGLDGELRYQVEDHVVLGVGDLVHLEEDIVVAEVRILGSEGLSPARAVGSS